MNPKISQFATISLIVVLVTMAHAQSQAPTGSEKEELITSYRVLYPVVRVYGYYPVKDGAKKYRADVIPSHFTPHENAKPHPTVTHARDGAIKLAQKQSFGVYERSELKEILDEMQKKIDKQASDIEQLQNDLKELQNKYKNHKHRAKISGPVRD
ncbi:hypothetical protein [Gimesia aquarii]|uniref:Uncharacterized protein n=1 Tax=Gimesia aquarii TaxID=2527964 RepID=A0A517VYE2_9PLAN|nr:hypothetical protein [Gimesia aquarii]QDT98020.1 hypothetical protein V144x_35040 [Gimesia aquarii]